MHQSLTYYFVVIYIIIPCWILRNIAQVLHPSHRYSHFEHMYDDRHCTHALFRDYKVNVGSDIHVGKQFFWQEFMGGKLYLITQCSRRALCHLCYLQIKP